MRYKRFGGGRLLLSVPEETLAAFETVTRVRVFYVDDLEIRLKRALLAALKECTRGPLLEQLLSGKHGGLRLS